MGNKIVSSPEGKLIDIEYINKTRHGGGRAIINYSSDVNKIVDQMSKQIVWSLKQYYIK